MVVTVVVEVVGTLMSDFSSSDLLILDTDPAKPEASLVEGGGSGT